MSELRPLDLFARLKWLDGRPLLATIEAYRRRLFEQFFAWDGTERRYDYNLGLFGRGKKNWKTSDAILAALYALMADSPGGNQVYVVANDEGQAADDLVLLKKIVKANPVLSKWLVVKKGTIERRDGNGFIETLPAQDAVGAHGKTFRLLVVDEIHGYRNWDLLEALAPDPTRLDAQIWITSYATLFHRPGVPLFDLMQQGRAGRDPRMLFSWYAGDFTTDLDFAEKTPEERANPSLPSWGNPEYLAQQQRRLPAHKYRRLHLNLPGLPEGSAYQPEPIMDAFDRGVRRRPRRDDVEHVAFVDMCGGSSDDAVLAVGHREPDGRIVLDCLQDQGPRPPFDPNAAVLRFVETLRAYGVTSVCGDRYAGATFKHQFEAQGIGYEVSTRSKHQIYEAFEPLLNGHRVSLLDVPTLEQQLLALAWRGGRIDHPIGQKDDHANSAAGLAVLAGDETTREPRVRILFDDDEWREIEHDMKQRGSFADGW